MTNYKQLADKLKNDPLSEVYQTDKIFSSCDISAYVTLPGQTTYRLGTLNMLSVSSHRDKFPITALGGIKVRGFTSSHRTIAGTMVFSSFDSTIWYGMMERYLKHPSRKGRSMDRFLPDELPPFDISVSFVNEMGRVSYTGVLGATILDEGETYSIDSINVMETYSYMAIDRIPFQPYDIHNFPGNENILNNQQNQETGSFEDQLNNAVYAGINPFPIISPFQTTVFANLSASGGSPGGGGCPDGSTPVLGPNGTYICNGVHYCHDGSVATQVGPDLWLCSESL